jgi:hypothetical protein
LRRLEGVSEAEAEQKPSAEILSRRRRIQFHHLLTLMIQRETRSLAALGISAAGSRLLTASTFGDLWQSSAILAIL